MDKLKPEQQVQLTALRAKLHNYAADLKAINDQGRLIASDPSQLFLFKGMYKRLDSYFDSFNEIWDKITEILISWAVTDVFPLSADLSLQKNIKRYYYEAQSTYEEFMNPTPQPPTISLDNSQSLSANESKAVRARLPQINLPTFDGNPARWPLFRDTYCSLIHNEPSLSEIEKFLFLVSCLSESALALIKGIEVQAANYAQAWKLLNDTFNDRRRLANNYLNTVLGFTPFKQRPTASGLKHLLSHVVTSIDSYKQLGIPNGEDFLLFSLLLRCLDADTRRAFEKKLTDTEFPSYKNLIDFLRVEWRSMELSNETYAQNAGTSRCQRTPQNYLGSKPNKPRTSLLTDVHTKGNSPSRSNNSRARPFCAPTRPCIVCKGSHRLYECERFRNAPPPQRQVLLRGWKGCTNCLSYSHTIDECASSHTCKLCRMKHHTLLHDSPNDNANISVPKESISAGVVLGSHSIAGEVLLGTAIIHIRNHQGTTTRVRAVIDNGSQHSFITTACADKLGLPISAHKENISGIGQMPLKFIVGRISCTVLAHSNVCLDVEPLVVPRITSQLPHAHVPPTTRALYSSYKLADEEFWKPSDVDFLLGGDLFYDILTGPPVILSQDAPRLLPTVFGFIVGGPSPKSIPSSSSSCLFVQDTSELRSIMQKFWEVEELSSSQPQSEEEKECETQFINTHYRLPSGRYVVSLPLKESVKTLLNPKEQALTRFLHLERRFRRQPLLKHEYFAFMKEYLSLGHMRLAPPSSAAYLIPHHSVSKCIGNKTKLRVVFDASCDAGGGSLNEHMYVGPKLQLDISDVISNFRTHRFVFTTDIVKMYRQILVDDHHRKYQHILWRLNDGDIQEFQLNTVTYGQRASAFLAQRTLKQLIKDEGSSYPNAAQTLANDMYVDDIATGADSVAALCQLKEEVVSLLSKGGFELGKWASNCSELLSQLPEPDRECSHICLSDENAPKIKLLGIHWNPLEDLFSYEIIVPPWNPTKRAILSAIARIYDPLGFIAPVTFYAKSILQETWASKLEWDEVCHGDIREKWYSFTQQLNLLSAIKIPRQFTHANVSYTIVGFCDASERGYAAVLYLKNDVSGNHSTSLLKSKTKLAPIKPLTIPRLELSASLLLSRLVQSCKPLMERLNISRFKLFTDSQIVLHWLSTPPHKLQTFVAHRVTEILDHAPRHQWNFVSSKDNPADCGSRGVLPADMINHPLWWHGPPWLSESEETWPIPTLGPIKRLPEMKPQQTVTLSAVTQSPIDSWVCRFSSYDRAVRSMAYVFRFINKLRRHLTNSGSISAPEFRNANKALIKIAQASYRENAKPLNSKPLKLLCPFVDGDGLLRVGGRLHNASIPYNSKHPYILPADHHLTRLIVDHYHRIFLHAGSGALRAILQTQYWIVGARSLIRQRIFKCLRCYKATRLPQIPIMGNIPSSRLQEGSVFGHVGVDLAGPFFIKESARRNASTGKAYLCLYVCMVTRAVHMEAVSQCSTEAFLASFARFIARRGMPSDVYSDCGTNFIGASNRIRDLLSHLRSSESQRQIEEYCAPRGITWHFNPPSAPHFGGSWEAAIKSCKSILHKVLGETPLRYEELATLFCRIEGVLNSRPLTPLEAEPDSLECLTPGHFLIGRPLTALPDSALTEATCLQNRWQLLKQQTQHFWQRWRMEYLNQLQQRRKWLRNRPNVQVNDLVIIKEPTASINQWPLARVVETHPGTDGVVRVVTLRTSGGILKRPIAKIVPLAPTKP